MLVTIQLSLSPPDGHARSCLSNRLQGYMIARGHRIVMKQLDHLSLVQTDYEHPSRTGRAAICRGMLMLVETRRRGKAKCSKERLDRDRTQAGLERVSVTRVYRCCRPQGYCSNRTYPGKYPHLVRHPERAARNRLLGRGRTKHGCLRLLRSEERNQLALKGPSAVVGVWRD